jgi:hypothetical protein
MGDIDGRNGECDAIHTAVVWLYVRQNLTNAGPGAIGSNYYVKTQ